MNIGSTPLLSEMENGTIPNHNLTTIPIVVLRLVSAAIYDPVGVVAPYSVKVQLLYKQI